MNKRFSIACAAALLPALTISGEELPVPTNPPTTPEEADAMLRALYPEESALGAEGEAAKSEVPRKRVNVAFRTSAAVTYDDNIFISPDDKQGDFIFSLTPGVTVGLGDYFERREAFLLFDYAATGLLFAEHSSENAVEQQAYIEGQYRLAKLTLGGEFRFLDLSGSNVEVGGRVERRFYQTSLFAKYDLSDKTYLDADFRHTVVDYETLLDSTESTARFWFNYRATPKLTVGVGAGAGVLETDRSGQQTYEQALGRVAYTPTEKLSFRAEAGVELRQSDEVDGRVNPVFSLAATYLPFAETQVKLSAYRRVESSAILVGQNFTITGVRAEITRRIKGRFDVALAGGYEHTDYNSVARSSGNSRTDNYFFVRPSVRFPITRRAQVEAYYLHRQNDSSQSRSGFENNQTGIQVSIAF